MVQQWEFMTLTVPLDVQVEDVTPESGADWSNTIARLFEMRSTVMTGRVFSEHGADASEALADAMRLANEGWELVTVIPRLAAIFQYSDISDRSFGFAYSFDRAYTMFFKRPKK